MFKGKELFKRRNQILKYINDFRLEHNYGPTVREIAKGVGLKSVSTVYTHIVSLEANEMIKNKDVARGVSVTEKGQLYLNSLTQKDGNQ